MKSKLIKFAQHLYHDIEDEEKTEEYLDNALPLIGWVVMEFNGLESTLDAVLCENFTERTDATGLIVLNKMNFATKVDLLKRFCDDFHAGTNQHIEGYDQLINDLKLSGRRRNLVVHADWESTDDEGYTYIRLKISTKGMEQEYIQLTEESLNKIIELIMSTRSKLGDYWEARDNALCNEMHSMQKN